MNEPTEEKNKSTDLAPDLKWSKQKKHAVAAVIVTLLAALVVPALAWLYYRRSIQTITQINEPYALMIGEGDARDIKELKLSDIDVSGGKGSKEVVFCVFGPKSKQQYNLELAHTTNIGFEYEIFKAEKNTNDNQVPFTKGDKVRGEYLNVNQSPVPSPSDAPLRASKQYHEKTYGSYDKVQECAEPLYWKASETLTLPENPGSKGHYIDYYVLRISWDDSIKNNKETDMIYLMAEATGSGT